MRRFAIVTDIDGVLYKSGHAIPGVKESILRIKDKGIPFTCLTNGGGSIEAKGCLKVNKILGAPNLIREEEMIECHTPLKEKVEEYRDRWVMVNGHG